MRRTPVMTRAGLPVPTDWKNMSYYWIFVVDWLRKMLLDEPVQIPINVTRFS